MPIDNQMTLEKDLLLRRPTTKNGESYPPQHGQSPNHLKAPRGSEIFLLKGLIYSELVN